MATLTENSYAGDWLLDYFSAGYCFEQLTVAQQAGQVGDMESGQVLQLESEGYVECVTGTTADAILVTSIPEADLQAGDVEALCLVRGPAVIDEQEIIIAAAELAGALTALGALTPPILPADVNATYDTQTT